MTFRRKGLNISKLLLIVCLLAVPWSVQAAGKSSVFLEVPQDKWVLQSEHAFVLEDIRPQAPVHLLVIPKVLVETLMDASPGLLGEMMQLAKQAAKTYGIDQTGFRIVINTRKQGGQSIGHLHIHVLGGRQMNWPPG